MLQLFEIWIPIHFFHIYWAQNMISTKKHLPLVGSLKQIKYEYCYCRYWLDSSSYLFKNFHEKFPEMVLMEWAKSQLNQMKGGSRDKMCRHFHISPKHLPPQMLEVIEENTSTSTKPLKVHRWIERYGLSPYTLEHDREECISVFCWNIVGCVSVGEKRQREGVF